MKKNIIRTISCCLGLAFVMGVSVPSAMAGQDEGFIKKGGELYKQYCASCHGVDGKGTGPAAAALKTAMSDLTMIKKMGKEFPTFEVMIIIEGEKVLPAHGSREMPVWGTILHRKKDAMQERCEIYCLTKYLESIQVFKQ